MKSISVNPDYHKLKLFQRFHEFFFQIQNVLMTIAKLKVFSHEIHEIFGDELEALAAIKQLKYFYNLPLGQLFSALAQLYKPNPNSAWWKAATYKLVVSHWSSLKVCDFLKDYVSLSFLSVLPTVHFHVFF